MVLDANLELFNATFNATTNSFSSTGSWLNLGRSGFPQGAQLYLNVPELNADRELTATLQITLDGGSTIRNVSALTVPKRAAGILGRNKIMVEGIAQDFSPQEYDGDNLDVRVVISATDHANDSDFGTVQAFISVGEKSVGLGSDV